MFSEIFVTAPRTASGMKFFRCIYSLLWPKNVCQRLGPHAWAVVVSQEVVCARLLLVGVIHVARTSRPRGFHHEVETHVQLKVSMGWPCYGNGDNYGSREQTQVVGRRQV